ncbi:hypothetical protein D3C86_2071400 [compost metagenome]
MLRVADVPVVIDTDFFIIQFFQFGDGGVGEKGVASLKAVVIKGFFGHIRFYKQQTFIQCGEANISRSIEFQPL